MRQILSVNPELLKGLPGGGGLRGFAERAGTKFKAEEPGFFGSIAQALGISDPAQDPEEVLRQLEETIANQQLAAGQSDMSPEDQAAGLLSSLPQQGGEWVNKDWGHGVSQAGWLPGAATSPQEQAINQLLTELGPQLRGQGEVSGVPYFPEASPFEAPSEDPFVPEAPAGRELPAPPPEAPAEEGPGRVSQVMRAILGLEQNPSPGRSTPGVEGIKNLFNVLTASDEEIRNRPGPKAFTGPFGPPASPVRTPEKKQEDQATFQANTKSLDAMDIMDKLNKPGLSYTDKMRLVERLEKTLMDVGELTQEDPQAIMQRLLAGEHRSRALGPFR